MVGEVKLKSLIVINVQTFTLLEKLKDNLVRKRQMECLSLMFMNCLHHCWKRFSSVSTNFVTSYYLVEPGSIDRLCIVIDFGRTA